MSNLANLSISALVAIYNDVAPKPVKSFKDKPTALTRVEGILEQTGMCVVFGSNGEYEVANKPEVAPVVPQETEAKSAPVKGKRGPKPADHSALLAQRITVLVDKNPKSRGAGERFACYQAIIESSNPTVGHYVEYLTKGALARTERQTLADVKWDVAHGFIKLEA